LIESGEPNEGKGFAIVSWDGFTKSWEIDEGRARAFEIVRWPALEKESDPL
jgi:hypothetical protein